jgi:hypothetical protein
VHSGRLFTGRRRGLAEDPTTYEGEAGAAIHLAFDRLDPIDVPFDRPLTPVRAQSGLDGSLIAPESLGKPDEFGNARLGTLLEPRIELVGVPFGDQRTEVRQQVLRLSDLGQRSLSAVTYWASPLRSSDGGFQRSQRVSWAE